MKKILIPVIAILVLGILAYVYITRDNSEWRLFCPKRHIYSLGYFDYYYSPKSISHQSKNVVKVWVKCSGWNWKREDHISEGAHPWQYSLILYEFDLSERKDRILSTRDCDPWGNEANSEYLGTKEYKNPEWVFFEPGSIDYELYQKIR